MAVFLFVNVILSFHSEFASIMPRCRRSRCAKWWMVHGREVEGRCMAVLMLLNVIISFHGELASITPRCRRSMYAKWWVGAWPSLWFLM